MPKPMRLARISLKCFPRADRMKTNFLLDGFFYSSGKKIEAMSSIGITSQFEVITDSENFLSLEQDWEMLWNAANAKPFLQFHYCLHTLREVALPAGGSLHCIIGRKEGRLIFVWPLVRYREYLWTALRPLAPDPSEPADLLLADGEDPEATITAAWRVLLASCGSDVISLPMVRTDSVLYRLGWREKCVSHGARRMIKVAPLSRYESWAQYRGELAPAFRKEQDYHQRRLSRAGKVEIAIATLAEADSAAYVRTMFDWKSQWAIRMGVEGDFFKEPYQNFVRKILADPALEPVLKLFVLSLDGKAIAMNLVAISAATVIGMQAAFDPAYAKLSPGSLLIEHVMKWAFDNGRDVDLGPGEGKYKSVWSGDSGYVCMDLRIAVSVWGRAVLRARAFRGQWARLLVRMGAAQSWVAER
ncbi:GNAT family N-acetyltransferase [Paraburkholderia sp. MMS20-SJTR3]|uniref:GNAT family N-acetyltransferase n=1 Tax=Paraburkholderia sejongensis TaxID=2886946 RepID=A0ABS8K5Q5_9BURK|nr:GNAT family N-acetyltransferase [Paraburkholderia sp. MMS20-SJTR3]MCC8397460.1 GNAT family N-acetyltransferase [Paraburkholderia sp. MMS20-SJTR3]